MARALTVSERDELLRSFAYTAFRLELQPAYAVTYETDTVAAFMAGEPEPPTEVPGLKAWFEQVGRLVGEGRRMERVRVHDDPPTPYQRWVRWIDPWNAEAGETIRYMTRDHAHDIGLLPAAGDTDWWLLDSQRLVTMRYDEQGKLSEAQLVTDPEHVVQACAWRDMAVHHSTIGTPEVPNRTTS